MGEERVVRELARLLKLGECLDYDACIFDDGIVVNIDGYALEYSKYPYLTLEDWGYRSVAAASSDVVASGGTPKAVLYSIGVPDGESAVAVARGVADAAGELGLRVLKSDLNRSRYPWIDVAVIGLSERPVPRSGAVEGQVLIQAGYLGYGLLEHLAYEGVVPLEEARRVKGFGRRLPPRVERVVARYASASSDNSDGWGSTLWNIADSSGASIILESYVLDPGVAGLLERHGVGLEEGLASWEDYNVAFTVESRSAGIVLEECRSLRVPCWVTGRVVGGSRGVEYKGLPVPRGWEWL